MPGLLHAQKPAHAIPIWCLSPADIDPLPNNMARQLVGWIKSTDFKAKPGEVSLVSGKDGAIVAVIFGTGNIRNDDHAGLVRRSMGIGKLARLLPTGDYHLEGQIEHADQTALGWLLGAYRFDRYLTADRQTNKPRLAVASGVDVAEVQRIADGVMLARDLINTPANDLGPDHLEAAFRSLALDHQAIVEVVSGEALLTANFPMVHAVGRASSTSPRLLDMRWGRASDPTVTLVGKGVSFDTGGLNIKPGSSMGLMKKDMGGAANAMGLASMIMAAKLPVRLRVIVPAVENSISANAFRPGDILPSRKGISVEIGNTDAEGRLILADALSLADEEAPELLVDLATLTGAARVALGPDLSPFYTDDQQLADQLTSAGLRLNDPLWRMPFWPPYQQMLSSQIADINHISTNGFAGSITAAMFLSKFVDRAKSWAHFDIYGWVPKEKPWAPVGGEAQAIRALFDVISARYPR